MSKHHKRISASPTIGKKEQERQRRQQQARQRMRLHTFTALALKLLTEWKNNALILDDLKSYPTNERRYIPMQIAQCHKACEAVVRMLNKQDQWPAPSSSFFEDASHKIQTLLAAVCNTMPETCRAIDIQIVMTYILYASLYEWEALAQDVKPEVHHMIRTIGAFADHVLQNDSPLLLPMNRVFWSMRDFLHSEAPLPIWDFSKCPEGSAEWERTHGDAA